MSREIRRKAQVIGSNWLFERSWMPGFCLGTAVFFIALGLGLSGGTSFALNFISGRIPQLTQAGRALYHRDFTYFSRSQAHQPKEIAAIPLDAKDLEMPQWMEWLIVTAERRDIPRPISWTVGQFEDWLNMRSRMPGFAIDYSFLLCGLLLFPIPWIILFPTTIVVGNVPKVIRFGVACANGGFTVPAKWWSPVAWGVATYQSIREGYQVFSKPGMWQRSDIAAVIARRAAAPQPALNLAQLQPIEIKRLVGRVPLRQKAPVVALPPAAQKPAPEMDL